MWTFLWKQRKSLGSTLEEGEVNALIRYAAENGLDKRGEIVPLLEKAKSEWIKNEKDPSIYNEMLKLYAKLAVKTKPISGRVLIDSENSDRNLRRLVVCTVLLIFVVATQGVLTLWFLDQPTPGTFGNRDLVQYILNYLSPFVWGALGACVYLLKHLYDLAGAQQFDAALYRGWWVRLVLGAVLGGVVAQIFSGTAERVDAAAVLSSNAMAFLTGLGVRVVYGAFERAVSVLAEKLNLGRVRSAEQSRGAEDARAVLSKQLAKTDAEQEPEKYQALLDLIRDLGAQEDRPNNEDVKK